ncbi:MAG: bifunctional UDP-N-acetylglucosamine diphosphorylase/glucosamine-1-phosphate N-acetyltransferase GlmU, partial [Anaerolineae bacterium]|nr:bifunctional UDP-N-acetylglucosamine diphosphorylase/glucosamine-1-phosphate N-acetyltransferase GlmU [Anaerolineae bacterium]
MKINTIILAAGQGTRMISELPKVLHPVNNKPLILYSIQAAKAAGSDQPLIIIGNGADAVKKTVGDGARFVLQAERLGTAHAVMVAESELKGMGDLVLVIAGDMPLLTADTMKQLVEKQSINQGPLTML